MKNEKLQNVLIYLISFLFIGSAILPNISGKTSNTIYVDDDGGADFMHIQNGIDAARPGDTIFVYSGTYLENLIIDKSLTLTGEDKTNTIIDVEDRDVSAVLIISDGIALSGFTITNGTEGIFISDSSCNIMCGNIITKNSRIGVLFEYSSENKILNNSILNNADAGIRLDYSSDNNLIDENIIKENGRGGVEIYHSSSNKITNNIISKNDHSGIILYDSANSTMVTDNSIEKNKYYGVLIGESAYNKVCRNNFINQSVHSRLFVTFKFFFEERNSYSIILNSWDNNYWDNWKFSFPKPISVYVYWKTPIIFIYLNTYWVYFDKHPVQIPYNIDV